MSNWREQFGDEPGFRTVTSWLGRQYHYLTLVLLVGFAFWNRARNWENFLVDGSILFSGNDPWYHLRSVQYTVEHYPAVMPYDVWTRFPFGTAPAQFGTLYDQIMATIALVVGLGSPSDELVRQVVLFSPALFGALVLLPAFYIGVRLGGRFAGVVSAAIIAFAPDILLARSLVGFSDHHVAEALFQAVGVLGLMVALRVAETEKPVWELVQAREVEALRRPVGWSVVAGIAVAAYLWTWPPGVFLVGIVGVFFLIHLSIEAVRGRSPEHTALVGVVAMTTAALLQLPATRTLELSPTSRSLLQPGLALAVAAGCLFLTWLFREWDARDLEKYGYPAAVLLVLAALGAFVALALPGLYNLLVGNLFRVVGFSVGPNAGTVGEAQPLGNPSALYSWYKMAIFTAVAGVLVVLGRQYASEEPPAEELLVVIWFVFMIAATFTQSRFAYYLAVPVASLTAVSIGTVMQYVGRVRDVLEIEPYQAMAVVAVLMVTIVPMFFGTSALAAADRGAQPGGVIGWHDNLEWFSENAPEQGQYANPGGEPMAYLGTFDRTDDYDYPEGSYGVMSWWDYGHWITVQGEAIPNANPFQQGATEAARYLLAQNESAAADVLAEVGEDDARTRYVMVDWKMAQTETQVNGKYFAPIQFADDQRRQYYSRIASIDSLRQNGILRGTETIRHKQAYYDSTLARLYLYHGSAMEPRPVVLDWQGSERRLGNGDWFVTPAQDGRTVKLFDSMDAARSFVANDSTSQVGGLGPYPTERVPAMEHYRLVHMSELSGTQGRLASVLQRDIGVGGLQQGLRRYVGQNATRRQLLTSAVNFLAPTTPSWVKTFERVPGATIRGTGPANTTVTLAVEMRPENGVMFQRSPQLPALDNGNFTYTQQVRTGPDGEFTATVPYSTTGYGELGPEDGYGNTTVRAAGPYRLSTPRTLTPDNGSFAIQQYTATAEVTEAQVVGADDSPVTVELEPTTAGTSDETVNISSSSGSGTTAGDARGSLVEATDLPRASRP